MLIEIIRMLAAAAVYVIVVHAAAFLFFVADAASCSAAPRNCRIACSHACKINVPGFFCCAEPNVGLTTMAHFLFSYLVGQRTMHVLDVSDVASCCPQAAVLDGKCNLTVFCPLRH